MPNIIAATTARNIGRGRQYAYAHLLMQEGAWGVIDNHKTMHFTAYGIFMAFSRIAYRPTVTLK